VANHPHWKKEIFHYRSDSRWRSIGENGIHVNKTPIVGSVLHSPPQNQMHLIFENGLHVDRIRFVGIHVNTILTRIVEKSKQR
jgi:hypothetical protein